MNPLSIRPDRLERIRTLCLALPEATEKEAWGDPTWRVCDKIFVMQKGNYEGGRPSIWLKADERQTDLVDSKPERFFVPPYVGNKGWVGIYLDRGRIPWALVTELIHESYGFIAPKRFNAIKVDKPALVKNPSSRKSHSRRTSMPTFATFDAWKKAQAPRHAKCIVKLRRLVAKAAPKLEETSKWGNGCWTKGDLPLLFLHSKDDHLQFGFFGGAPLVDPNKLLRGRAKYVRHVRIETVADIDEAKLAKLVKEAVAAPPYR